MNGFSSPRSARSSPGVRVLVDGGPRRASRTGSIAGERPRHHCNRSDHAGPRITREIFVAYKNTVVYAQSKQSENGMLGRDIFCLRCRRRPTFDAHAAFDARERTRARGTRVRRLSRTNARALASSSRRLRDHRATAENARERGRAARASVLRSRPRVKSPPYPSARDRVASLRDRAARRPRRARATGEHDALRLHENPGRRRDADQRPRREHDVAERPREGRVNDTRRERGQRPFVDAHVRRHRDDDGESGRVPGTRSRSIPFLASSARAATRRRARSTSRRATPRARAIVARTQPAPPLTFF